MRELYFILRDGDNDSAYKTKRQGMKLKKKTHTHAHKKDNNHRITDYMGSINFSLFAQTFFYCSIPHVRLLSGVDKLSYEIDIRSMPFSMCIIRCWHNGFNVNRFCCIYNFVSTWKFVTFLLSFPFDTEHIRLKVVFFGIVYVWVKKKMHTCYKCIRFNIPEYLFNTFIIFFSCCWIWVSIVTVINHYCLMHSFSQSFFVFLYRPGKDVFFWWNHFLISSSVWFDPTGAQYVWKLREISLNSFISFNSIGKCEHFFSGLKAGNHLNIE